MISRDNIKYCIFVAFISILIYKAIDNPAVFISSINDLFKFLSPFLLAVLMCLLLNPVIMFLEKKFKMPRLLNIFISYFFIFLFFCFCINLIMPSLIDALNTLITEIPNYTLKIDALLNKYVSNNHSFDSILPHIQAHLDSALKHAVKMLNTISSDFLIYIFSITSIIFNIIMGIILSIYILCDKENILKNLKSLLYSTFSKKRSTAIIEFFDIINKIFYHYIIGSLIVSLVVGIITFIGFKFFINIKGSLFLSFIVFITNMIPYFGPFIGALLPILMTLSYSPIKALWVAIFLLVLQQVDGNIIAPKIMGEFVGLHPLWIICAVLIGGALFGLIGVFLSVPVAAVIKTYLDKYIEKSLNIPKSE
ncbi:AI-2E family transporter [Paraclostridium bifermentans]|uniref:AI-2E family transporter n=1 Tax=Paraclostridium bifermentans TaxID=1490 RepID=UPI000A16D7ED|nr:AI-2E family transporter [Paraclostridium bifermentans]OSB12206.1 AI-2E family transporter [Paraclostridium bifermentans]